MRTEKARDALRRMLANGPLTGLPMRQGDLDLVLALAALRFVPGRNYSEREVNDVLRDWLATFCAPYGVDHVTLRRCLVDARILHRDKPGSHYCVDPLRIDRANADIDLARLLAEIQSERAARKRAHV